MSLNAAKEAMPRIGQALLGHRNFARLARFLWLRSRHDVPNDFVHNGEMALQDTVVQEIRGEAPFVVFDVGANVGDWSEPLVAAALRAGKAENIDLHVFEPTPESFAMLRGRLEERDRLRVTCNQAAAAAESGTLSFHLVGETAGTNALRPSASDPVHEVLQVRAVSLDDYCRERGIDRIDYLKIDTEGADLDVLRGAAGLLADGAIRYAQFEYNHRWVFSRAFLHDVFALVGPRGYRIGKITPQGIERYRSWHPELESFREGNYLIWRDHLPAGRAELVWWNQPQGDAS